MSPAVSPAYRGLNHARSWSGCSVEDTVRKVHRMWQLMTLQIIGWPERVVLVLLVVLIVLEVLRIMP